MIRSRTVNTIHELSAQGKSIQDIAITLGIARNTVRKYLRHPELVAMPHPRPNRGSKLDPFKEQIVQWMKVDHCYNCEAMLPRLLAMGYTGSLSVLKAFVHPLRPPAQGHYPVVRYETEPGKQVQFDWGEFKYEQDGAPRKLYGFTAILCYSRMRFVTFVKRCDAPTMIRCLMEAFEYFCGLHGLHWGGTPGLQGVYPTNEREGRAHRWGRQTELVARDRLQGYRRPQSSGTRLVRAHQQAGPSHHSRTAPRAPRAGAALTVATGLCLGTFCHRRAQSQLGWLPILRWNLVWLAFRSTGGRKRGPGA